MYDEEDSAAKDDGGSAAAAAAKPADQAQGDGLSKDQREAILIPKYTEALRYVFLNSTASAYALCMHI